MADPVHQWRESFRSGAVVGLAPLAAIANQPGTLQDGQMLRNHRLRHTRALRQRVNRLVAVAGQPFENGSASRIGEGPEETVCGDRHAETITQWLWFVNQKILRPLDDVEIISVKDGKLWSQVGKDAEEEYFPLGPEHSSSRTIWEASHLCATLKAM